MIGTKRRRLTFERDHLNCALLYIFKPEYISMGSHFVLKICSALLCWFAGLCGIGAIFFRSGVQDGLSRNRAISLEYINAFTAGVFLSIAMVHMLPDASELLERRGGKKGEELYPFANLLAVLFFIFTYGLESIVVPFINSHSKQMYNELLDKDEESGCSAKNADGGCGDVVTKDGAYGGEEICLSVLKTGTNEYSGVQNESLPTKHKDGAPQLGKSLCVAFTMFVLLSVHSFFAGIALGLGSTSVDILSTLFAILLHKGLASFSLASRLALTSISNVFLASTVLAFSLVTPSGVILGSFFSQAVSGKNNSHVLCTVRGCIFAIASGVFLYVGSSELFSGNQGCTHNHPNYFGVKVFKYGFTLAGCGLIAILAIWA